MLVEYEGCLASNATQAGFHGLSNRPKFVRLNIVLIFFLSHDLKLEFFLAGGLYLYLPR